MELSVTPPVDEVTERVLQRALDAVGLGASGVPAQESVWRLAALQEGVERDDDEVGYTPSPRRTRGATRA